MKFSENKRIRVPYYDIFSLKVSYKITIFHLYSMLPNVLILQQIQNWHVQWTTYKTSTFLYMIGCLHIHNLFSIHVSTQHAFIFNTNMNFLQFSFAVYQFASYYKLLTMLNQNMTPKGNRSWNLLEAPLWNIFTCKIWKKETKNNINSRSIIIKYVLLFNILFKIFDAWN